MTDLAALKVLFVAGFGPIVTDPRTSHALFVGALGLPLQARPDDPDYYHGETLDGVRHFALWPIASAAQSCFGTDKWPSDVATPQGWIEFDVEDAREEPWGQTVTRLLSPEGLLVGLTKTPWLR